MNKPIFFFWADTHLRQMNPRCRVDDYWKAQKDVLKFAKKLQKKYGVPFLTAGDIFHKHNPTLITVTLALKHFPYGYAISGNHDLPKHKLELQDKSGVQCLHEAGNVYFLKEAEQVDLGNDVILHGFPFGTEVKKAPKDGKKHIAICHFYSYNNKNECYKTCQSSTISKHRKILKNYDLVIIGDNHIPWKYKNTISPGSTMQIVSNQKDYKPCLYAYDGKQITAIPIPIEKGTVTEEHIINKKHSTELSKALTDKIKNKKLCADVDFRKNMNKFLSCNKVHKKTNVIIQECIGG